MARVRATAVVALVVMALTTGTGICGREKLMTSNVTETLDFLLASDRYDKRLRPDFGGPPITIEVNFFIKSMGPVSDNDQSFGLDCYFRQHWYDWRLQYPKLPGLEEFSMSWLFLDRVWKPDTYFVNGKKSFLHRITAPNKFLRLRHDGLITYSMRLTISASCPMYLRKFPLDSQKCPLILGSYGYSKSDLIYKWTEESAIGLQEGVEIAQFDLVNVTTENERTMMKGGLPYSTIHADFWLKRHTGYFMLQVYIPCGLIVVCSWISFWIDPDAVPARVNLGVTTVLSLTTMGFGGRSQMPKVSYWTALDWFIIICFTSVFSVMLEYAIVNLNDKFKKDLKKMLEKQKAAEEAKKSAMELSKIQKKLSTTRATAGKVRSASFSFANRTDSDSHDDSQQDQHRRVVAVVVVETEPDEGFTTEQRDTGISQSCRPRPNPRSTRSNSIPNLPADRSPDNLWTEPGPTVADDLIDFDRDPAEIVVNLGPSTEPKRVVLEREISIIKRPKLLRIKCLLNKFGKYLGLKNCCRVDDIDGDNDDDDDDSTGKFSRLDVQSRKNFPLAFIISLLIYLLAFTYYLTDDMPGGNLDFLFYKD